MTVITHSKSHRGKESVVFFPERFEKLCERQRQIALHTQRVVDIDRLLEASIQEVRRERVCRAQTLQRRIHVTRTASQLLVRRMNRASSLSEILQSSESQHHVIPIRQLIAVPGDLIQPSHTA